MKVLSLFDGMSCGQIALRELGITPEEYYASEIDRHAIAQTQLNFPDTIQLGDVVFLRKAMCWRSDTVEKMKQSSWISDKTKAKFARLRTIDWKAIDLILAGSPCQGFSFAGKQLAFDDPRSKLFFVFIDILNNIKALNPNVLFLLENVNMKRSHMRIISEYCGVFPVNINSNLVSAQNRDRWYWTNIRTKQVGLFGELHSDIPQPKDKGIFIRDIIESEVDEKYYLKRNITERMISNLKAKDERSNCLLATAYKGSQANGMTLINDSVTCIAMRGREACLTPKRTEYGKAIRKDYEAGKVQEKRKNIQQLEPRNDGKTNCLTSVDKDNLILQRARGNNEGGIFENKTPTLTGCSWEHNNLLSESERIRRLTPTECARLQTIPYWYEWNCSETQQYKMLGNGWTVEVIKHILSFYHGNEIKTLCIGKTPCRIGKCS